MMVEVLGRQLILGFDTFTSFFKLVGEVIYSTLTPPFRIKDTLNQFYFMANQSTGIVLICVGFAASVTIMEASFHMKLVIQNDSMVPGFTALLILRELGAVVSMLLITSRVGAGWAAEVGSMQITEQVDALRILGIDPIRYLVVPKFVASVLGGVVISALANIFCVACAMMISTYQLGYTIGGFISAMNTFVGSKDLLFAVIKGGCFGAVIPMIACFFGFRCKAGAEGVGLATTNAVVAISVTIIFLDFILTWLFSFFY